MAALLADHSVGQHHDPIRVADRVQPMGYQHGGLVAPVPSQPAVQMMLCLRVQPGARLIHDHEVSAAAQVGAGQRDSLQLAAG